MARHSKWANIQARKSVVDKKRAVLFTKLVRAITVAAREGGADTESNFKLRMAMLQARTANVPKDNIDRAVLRGVGGDGAHAQAMLYEIFGPAGSAFLVEALTDNNNRTAAEIKHLVSKHDGSVGAPGSVQWMFERVGMVRVASARISDREQFELAAIDVGAADIVDEGDDIVIIMAIVGLQKVVEAVEALGAKPSYTGIEWRPKERLTLSAEAAEKVETLYDALEEHEEVQNIWTNVEEREELEA